MAEKILQGPFEILELKDGESKEMTVAEWILGSMVIHPRFPGAPAEKVIVGIRIIVPSAEKMFGPPYWDLTSQTLRAQLEPILDDVKRRGRKIRITARGFGPGKRFTVTVV